MITLTMLGQHRIFSLYIPPVDSFYFKDEQFSDVSNVFQPKNPDYAIIGGGDLNTRIGTVKSHSNFNLSYSKNPDETVNSHGRSLLQICKSESIIILNHLKNQGKSFDGDFTYIKGDKKSQNDIGLSIIQDFHLLILS